MQKQPFDTWFAQFEELTSSETSKFGDDEIIDMYRAERLYEYGFSSQEATEYYHLSRTEWPAPQGDE